MPRADIRQSIEESPFAGIIELTQGIVRQQWAIIVSFAALVVALGAFYAYTTPPTFKARATMIIDRGKPQVQLGGILNEVQLDSVGVQSQIQIIKSEAIALPVIKKLALLSDPEFASTAKGASGWLRSLTSILSVLRPGSSSDVEVDPTRAVLQTLLDRLAITRNGFVVDIEFSSRDPDRAAQIANAFADGYIEDQLKYKEEATREAGSWLRD